MGKGVEENSDEEGCGEKDGGGRLAMGNDSVPINAAEVSLGRLGCGCDFGVHHVMLEFDAPIITGTNPLLGSVLTHFWVHLRSELVLNQN